MSGDEAVQQALCDELASLSVSERFTVVEFGAGGLSVWTVYRDTNGTPLAKENRITAGPPAGPDRDYERRVAPALGDRLLLIACTTPDFPGPVLDLMHASRQVPVHYCQTPLAAHLRKSIRDSPLLLGYGLAVLSRQQGSTGISLRSRPLFGPGARSGDTARMRVRCAPADGAGTVFAIVTQAPLASVAPNDRPLQPVQVQSAPLAPGSYELEAVLSRPGRVELTGLPGALTDDSMPWDELTAQVPAELPGLDAVHLVCALEVSGGQECVQHRIDRLEQLITVASRGSRPLVVSVVAYGPHSVAWKVPEQPVTTVTRTADGTQAVLALRGLAGKRPQDRPPTPDREQEPDREYPDAAQLECALGAAGQLLASGGGRPVLVTAGGRPPHPPEANARTDLLPCPDRVDWEWQFSQLAELPGITFGALCDQGEHRTVWRRLGRHARATVDVVDIEHFATGLGLHEPGQVVSFPFTDEGGT